MWPSIGMGSTGTAPVQFAGRQQSIKVSDDLMQKLQETLNSTRQGVYTYEASAYGESDVIISRKQTSDSANPQQIEFLFINGSREITLSADGHVLKATCAGKSAPRLLAKTQAKSMVENFLMQLFSKQAV